MRLLTLLTLLFIACAPVRHTVNNVQNMELEPQDPVGQTSEAEEAAPAEAPKEDVVHIKFNTDVNGLSALIAIGLIDRGAAVGAKAILLELDTPGGSVKAGFRLSKAIENSPVPVICVVDGEADSMGFYILQACDVRLMTKRSVLMAHQPQIGGEMYGPKEQWKNWADALKALEWAMIEHMVAKMKITSEEMAKRIEGGQMWWFDWREAIHTGAVDGTVQSVRAVLNDLKNGEVKTLDMPAEEIAPAN